MKTKRTTAEAIAENSRFYCTAQGCNSHRHKISTFCLSHFTTASRYGHPNGRALDPAVFQWERTAVQNLLAANANHPALTSATSYLTNYFARAAISEKAYVGAEEIARLGRHGVTSAQVICEVAALWCYLDRNPRALPSQKASDYAISRAVLQLAPRPRRVAFSPDSKGSQYSLKPRNSALGAIGTHLRQVLSVLLVNISQSLATQQDRAAAVLEAMREPLQVNVAQIMESAVAKPTPRQFWHSEGMTP